MPTIQRRPSATVNIGGVRVGSNVPVVVQSMTNTDTADIESTIQQVAALARAGSEMVRVTVNNDEAAKAVPYIVDQIAAKGWKTPIIGVREVAAGATVGYGATFVAAQPMRLALLPVGYADGFRRAASSGIGDGWVMIAGQRAPVVGRVSMNLTVVDVSGIEDVHEGMEAVLLGEGVTAEDHARWSGTIAYDILCGIRARGELT